jgi:soluble lytic murein transglycosylase-like protein
MRPLLATACICLIASSGSIATDQKSSIDRFDGPGSVVSIPPAATATTIVSKTQSRTADRLAPPDDAFDPLPLGSSARFSLAVDEAPVDIPTQADTAALIAPRDLPSPPQSPKPVVHRTAQEVCDTVKQAAQRNDLPVPFFIRLLFQESRFKPGAVSNAGAQGIAQFMPKTADAIGLDNPFDPLQAIPASARLLRNLFEQFGNLGLAAAAYNAGPKRIHDWLARKSKLPEETQGYVKTITGRPAENWKQASAGTPAIKLPPHAPCQDAAGLLAYNGPDEIPVPPASPRHGERIARVHKASVKVAARHHHGRDRSTTSLAARRKEPHGGRRKGADHRLASAN